MEHLKKENEYMEYVEECNEPGTGEDWCQPCNAKRFKDNFKNWTSGNKDIDEFIQQSQLNAVHPEWSKGYLYCWDVEDQKWERYSIKVVLKSLDNSSYYCENGNLRNYYLNYESNYSSKMKELMQIASGLLDIHNAGKVHKDFHSGNILYDDDFPYISDLGNVSTNLIIKCWDAKEEDRPTAKELYEELKKFHHDDFDEDIDDIESIESQIYEYDVKIKLNRTSEKRSNNIQTHPQAIYTSRLLKFQKSSRTSKFR
ncbi:unnamed protein product [Rhizophagus irregularis]|nr:unnamed protein product [Rhizophagus irregularis]